MTLWRYVKTVGVDLPLIYTTSQDTIQLLNEPLAKSQ